MFNRNSSSRHEAKADQASVEAFSKAMEALDPAYCPEPSRLKRVANFVGQIIPTIQETITGGNQAAHEEAVRQADNDLEQHRSTQEQIQLLRDEGIGVIIYPFK